MTWLKEQVESGHVAQFIICVESAGGNGDSGPQEEDGTCEESGDREIGSVYLRDIDREKETAEYGVFIGEEEALGRGYGTEAAKLMLTYGFEELGLKKVFLRFLEGNIGARKSYEKAGFRMIEGRRETVNLEQGRRTVFFMEAQV